MQPARDVLPAEPPSELAGPAAPDRSRRWPLIVALVSFTVCALAPLLSRSPYADLTSEYTDHLRHAHNTWLFLHRGLDIYREPFGQVARGVEYRHPMLQWTQVPYAYPPLALVLYLPYALAGQYLPLSGQAFARVGILYLLAVTHLALYALLRLLGRPTLAGLAVAAVSWLLLVRAALQGFYDPAWVACGVVMLDRLRRERPGSALGWFTLAALLSYRSVVLSPLALVAMLDSVRGRPWRAWPWARLLGVAFAGLVCVALFTFVLPHAEGFREFPPLISSGGSSRTYVLAMSALALLVAALGADLAVAGVVVVTSAMALVDTHQWWHALMLLVAPLAVGAWRPARLPSLSRAVLLAWLFVLHTHAWGGPPSFFWAEVRAFIERSVLGRT